MPPHCLAIDHCQRPLSQPACHVICSSEGRHHVGASRGTNISFVPLKANHDIACKLLVLRVICHELSSSATTQARCRPLKAVPQHPHRAFDLRTMPSTPLPDIAAPYGTFVIS